MEPLITNKTFFEEKNSKRKILLRGVNLGGDTKVPFPNGGTHCPSDFLDHKTVSFIGRPFPLAEMEEHVQRLKLWGFNCVRLLTTWEAIEHFGPKQYDIAYLEYYEKIIQYLEKESIYVFIDFHQDVWSRMSGGDGAPGWVFEKLGLDLTKLDACDGVLTMQKRYDYSSPQKRQEQNYPMMSWTRNYGYPINSLLWTLFFGGNDFAKNWIVDGQNVQDFLQSHFLGSMMEVAKIAKKYSNVLGFDSLNEPSRGWIGQGLDEIKLEKTDDFEPAMGPAWSPLLSLFSLKGNSVKVPNLHLSFWKRKFVIKNYLTLNPNKVSPWLDVNSLDPFERMGVYKIANNTPIPLQPDHFQVVQGKKIDFDKDYLLPFHNTVAKCIQSIRSDWMLFGEREALATMLSPTYPGTPPKQFVNAAHWYDLVTLFFKRFLFPISFHPIRKKLVFGRKGILNSYMDQLGSIAKASSSIGVPTVVGEFGIPFDLESGKAYTDFQKLKTILSKDSSNYPEIRNSFFPKIQSIWKKHIMALGLMYDAMDALFLNCTLWNYTASNSNDLKIGDGWNQEDLSIFSKDQILPNCEIDLHGGGGRAIEGFARPFVQAWQGEPISMKFDSEKKIFSFSLQVNPTISSPTELVLPRIHFPKGAKIKTNLETETWVEGIRGFVLCKEKGVLEVQVSE